MANNNDHYNHALPAGYILDNFEIIRVLGVGGFGIAYLAKDTYFDEECVIKEYMPNAFAYRDATLGTVNPSGSNTVDSYQWGLNEFLNEAKTIKKCKHQNIVEVIRFFEANNTAYMVMPYIKGNNLAEHLRKSAKKTMSEQEIKRIVIPLLEGLKTVHAKNIFHRDIKLSNIYIYDKNHTPILIDFGSARFSLGEKSRSLTTILTPGYSPHEQYHRHGKQGAWTDIYSMGAVMYYLISGKKPLEAPARVVDDPLPPATEIGKGKYSATFLAAIDHALAFKESDRPQSIEQWLLEIQRTDDPIIDKRVGDNTVVYSDLHHATDSKKSKNSGNNHSRPKHYMIPKVAWVIILLLVIGILALSAKLFLDNKNNKNEDIVQPTIISHKVGLMNTAIEDTNAIKTNKETENKEAETILTPPTITISVSEAKNIEKWITIGRKHSMASEFKQALVYYNKITKINPQHARTLRYKGYAHYRLGSYSQAIDSLTTAEAIESGNFYNILNLMKAYCAAEQYTNIGIITRQYNEMLVSRKKQLLGDSELKKSCKKITIADYLND